MMRVLVIQHTQEEEPGTLLGWLREKNLPHLVHKIFQYPNLPNPQDFQFLVVLGGTMNVDQVAEYSWLATEKIYIRRWIESGKSYLGLCLGSQLLAQAMGAKVVKNPVKEIGFHPAEVIGTHPLLADWPKKTMVYQWHEDTFELPSGTTSLISSPVCARQAFAVGLNQLGLQFHPESSRGWIVGNHSGMGPEWFKDQPYTQSLEDCLPLMEKHLPELTQNFHRLLNKFCE